MLLLHYLFVDAVILGYGRVKKYKVTKYSWDVQIKWNSWIYIDNKKIFILQNVCLKVGLQWVYTI
jgi:acetyl-CoA carboxylase carboxyltransferase component